MMYDEIVVATILEDTFDIGLTSWGSQMFNQFNPFKLSNLKIKIIQIIQVFNLM